MDDEFKQKLRSNGRRFQKALEKIVEKYSKVQYEHDAVEVDLENTRLDTLGHYMTRSRKDLEKMESMSFIDLREESLQDSPKESVLDATCGERSDLKATYLSEDDDMVNDATGYSVSPLDESQRNYTLLSDQPEDQDEELEESLQSQGSSLGERYPDMVGQIGKAWHRQHVTEAAESVRRRYRKWLKSARMHRTNSSDVDQRCSKREQFSKQHQTRRSPVRSVPATVAKSASASPVKITMVNGQKPQYCCSPVRSEAPAVVVDMPAFYEESSGIFNKTFTVSEPSLLSTFTTGPSRSCYSPTRPIKDFSLRMKESPRHSSVHDSTFLKEIDLSPVRTSPYKAKMSRERVSECSDIYGSPRRKSSFKQYSSKEDPQQSPYASVSNLSRERMSECSDIYDLPKRKSPFKLLTRREGPQQSPHASVSNHTSPNLSRECVSECSDIYGSPRRKSSFKQFSSKEGPQQSPYASVSNLSRERVSECSDIYGSPRRKSPFKPLTRREGPQQSPYASVSNSTSLNLTRELVNECSDIYCSPRKSLVKLHKREGPQQSPYACAANPTSPNLKGLKRSVSASIFVPSPTKLPLHRNTLEYPTQRSSTDLQWSPQLSRPRRLQHGLKRHLSFDSVSRPLNRQSYSDKDFDEDFVKLYHKLVCQSKSSFLKGHPCRFCAKNSDTSRGHSNLAALALSPHRPLLRKRSGDLQNYPLSKRFRDGQAQMEY